MLRKLDDWPAVLLAVISGVWLLGGAGCSRGHSRRGNSLILTVGLKNADVTGDDNRAIQKAIDRVAAAGGGTVTIKAGTYTLDNSVRLASNVTLRGEGVDKTILKKAQDVRSPLKLDADATSAQATVEDSRGFFPGMGVVVFDSFPWQGLYPNVKTIERVEGSTLFFNTYLGLNYMVDRAGEVSNFFPLIAGYNVEDVSVSNLTADGNRAGTETYTERERIAGGAIYFYHSNKVSIRNCVARNVAGDGISTQFVENPIIENCDVYGNAALGIHLGTSALQPIVRHNRSHNNGDDGLYLCWNVKHGIFEENECWGNARDGISIGHNDTDNTFVKNVLRHNLRGGVRFRDEGISSARNDTLYRNIIQDNGRLGAPGYGVWIGGATQHITLHSNTICETRSGRQATQRMGIYIGPHADYVTCKGNVFGGNPERAIVNESKGRHNKLVRAAGR